MGPFRAVGTCEPSDHSVEGGLGIVQPAGPGAMYFAKLRMGVNGTAKTFDLSINHGVIAKTVWGGWFGPGLSHIISIPLNELKNPNACLADINLC